MFDDENEQSGNGDAFWRFVCSQFFVGRFEGKEITAALSARTQRETAEMHTRKREEAVWALTRKYKLQKEVVNAEWRLETLRERAEDAERNGSFMQAVRLREAATAHEQDVAATRTSLSQATEAADAAMYAACEEQRRIRQEIADKLGRFR